MKCWPPLLLLLLTPTWCEDAPSPFLAPQPPFAPLAFPFPHTWNLSRSTIILTGNSSGWTDAMAARYGVVAFDWANAKPVWLEKNRSDSKNEESLLEQAKRVKALESGTRVFVYRNAMQAMQWQESQRAVMYDDRYSGFFLRCRSGEIWHRGGDDKIGSCGAGVKPQAEGDIFFWDFRNASAAAYFMDVVVAGPRGTGSDFVDGVYIDDPGPSTAKHVMEEYTKTISAAAHGAGMRETELGELAQATYHMMKLLRERLHAAGTGVWFNSVDFANPLFEAGYDKTCVAGYGLCGWWMAPQAGSSCIDFYRARCGKLDSLPLGVTMDPMGRPPWNAPWNFTREGKWRFAIATFLLFRGKHAYLVTSSCQQTGHVPLLWDEALELDVGVPLGPCREREGQFMRTWSKGTVSLSCQDLSVTLDFAGRAAQVIV